VTEPARKLGVYLDTTVISAAEDARAPDRRDRTLEFFARVSAFQLFTSELTHHELVRTPDDRRRQLLLDRLSEIQISPVTDEMQSLADEYVRAQIIPEAFRDDAVHVAAAVLGGQEVLASWNFRHMVNRRRRSLVNLLNESRGLNLIEIVTPAEL
jgi:predicted nucleic acid-binding protein